jgi:acetoacetyl-CoA synthetase
MDQPVWIPSRERIASSRLAAFMARVEREWSVRVSDYAALHRFSVSEPEKFWGSVWDFCGIVAACRGSTVVEHPERMPGARWFPHARLNFAENLLRRRDGGDALVYLREDTAPERMSFRALYDEVSRLAQALSAAGVGPGDRVAAYLPNAPETVVAMLATTSIGAVWCACSPELGVQAAADRLGQVDPAVLFVAHGYRYGGRYYDTRDKSRALADRIAASRVNVVLPAGEGHTRAGDLPSGVSYVDFIAAFPAREIDFVQFPFDHPAFILFSSGTTGVPKCIVHGAGGALLENLNGHVLHFDVRAGDRIFWWTSSGWVVWNIMTVALAAGATLLLYDGSPFHPSPEVLWDYAAREKVTFMRLTPKYIETIAKAGLAPRDTHDLGALRCITVGGAPFGASGYAYLYEKVKADMQVASPAGGTDPFAALVSGHSTAPVWPGEIQCPALGIAVAVFGEDGRPLDAEAGELVCTRSFPSMPVGLWNDPQGSRFRESYFARFPGVWSQGDWAAMTPRGGVVIYGRSDATLKVRGVRIGTAEIHRQLERLPEVADSAAVAWRGGDEEQIVLFVQTRAGTRLDAALAARIRSELRTHASPRHVPDLIVELPDLPRTITGKVSEAAIREALHGREVANRESLANPQALDAISATLLSSAC